MKKKIKRQIKMRTDVIDKNNHNFNCDDMIKIYYTNDFLISK